MMKKIIISIASFALVLAAAPVMALSIAEGTSDVEVQKILDQLRVERQVFRDAKAQVETERTQAAKEKIVQKKEQAEARRAQAEKSMEERRKAVLLKLIDLQIKHFNKTNDRVQKMPNITDELKAQLKTEIDAAISALNSKKTEVQNTADREGIKKLAKELRDFFKAKRVIVSKIVDSIHASRAEKVVETANERIQVVKAELEKLKKEGKNTAEMEAKLAEVEKNISKAKDKTAGKDLKNALGAIKSAYQNLADIARKANESE